MPRHHLLSVLVENKAGVLARVAGLFSRRGFNIFSLAVAPTDDERFSRISIVVDVESAPLEQIVDQLDKLINVVEISELHPDEAREAELLLVSVSADAGPALPGHRARRRLRRPHRRRRARRAHGHARRARPTRSTTSRSSWRRTGSWSCNAPVGSRSLSWTGSRRSPGVPSWGEIA